MKTTLGIVAVIIIATLGYFAFVKTPAPTNESGNSATSETGGASGMRAEENMIVVTDQRPGNTITASQVYLAAPGFVVIHENANGTPGAIIGASGLLPAGESSQIGLNLTRSMREGEKLHAMLHNDTDGNGTFSASADAPVQSRLGGPINGMFEVSATASENIPVSI